MAGDELAGSASGSAAGAASSPPVRHAAVLGSPISHSLSPILHRAAYRELGLPWTYEAIELQCGGLADFVLTRDESWAGLSLTMPLKVTALEVVDCLDPLAELTRSVNTIVFGPNGRAGYNTDVYGITAALRERSESALAVADAAAVIGAGATAGSALAALAELGIRRVTVAARRPERAGGLEGLADALGIKLAVLPWPQAADCLGASLVISTVPRGIADELAEHLPKRPGLLLDVVYAPWPTKLAAAWYSAGGTVVGGLSMLVWQAAEQVRLMTGREAPFAAMQRAADAAVS